MGKYHVYIKESEEYGSKTAHQTEIEAKNWSEAKKAGNRWKRENGYKGKVEVESLRGSWRRDPVWKNILYPSLKKP